MQLAIYGLASLVGTAVIASAGTYLLAKPEQSGEDTWADAGEVSEMKPGTPQKITFDRERVDGWEIEKEKATAWVILGQDGELSAFSPLCTHLGCAYHWESNEGKFVCPCHGSQFDAHGNVTRGPASRPLDRLQAKVEGARLWLGPIAPAGNT